MYCPNCGIEIHTEGSFCAKCRKNIAYLTKLKENAASSADKNTENPVPSAAEAPGEPETAAVTPAPVAASAEKPAPKGYFCNYCGTFVYPEDHYCYDCGKKTRPAYYREDQSHKNLYIAIAAVIICGIAAYALFS